MKTLIKKSLSIFLSVLMLVTYSPIQVFAESRQILPSKLSEVLQQAKVYIDITPYKVGRTPEGDFIKYYRDGDFNVIDGIPTNAKRIVVTHEGKSEEYFFEIGYRATSEYKDIVKHGDFITSTGEIIPTKHGKLFAEVEDLSFERYIQVVSRGNNRTYKVGGVTLGGNWLSNLVVSDDLYAAFLEGAEGAEEELLNKVLDYKVQYNTKVRTIAEKANPYSNSGNTLFTGSVKDVFTRVENEITDNLYPITHSAEIEHAVVAKASEKVVGANVADLQARITELENLLGRYERGAMGTTKLEKLQKGLQQYAELFKDFSGVNLVSKESGELSELDKLAQRLAEKSNDALDMSKAIREFIVQEHIAAISDMQTEVTSILKRGYASEGRLDSFIKEGESFLTENVKYLKSEIDKMAKGLKSDGIFVKFTTQVQKEKFLKNVYEKLMEFLMAAGREQTAYSIQMSIAKAADDSGAYVMRLVDLMVENIDRFAAESTAKLENITASRIARGVDGTIVDMLRELKASKNSGEKMLLAEKMESELDPKQKQFVKELLDIDDTQGFAKGLLERVPGEGDAAAGKVANHIFTKVGTKVVVSLSFVLAGLLTFSMIRDTKALHGNQSSDFVARGEALREKALNGTLTPQEINDYMHNEAVKSEIVDDPVLYSVYFLMTAASTLNLDSEKILDDEIMQIKGWKPQQVRNNAFIKHQLNINQEPTMNKLQGKYSFSL